MSRGSDPVIGGMVTTGLTIREHYAAQFMAAMISNPVYDALEACVYSERARMYADQLLAELSKPVSP